MYRFGIDSIVKYVFTVPFSGDGNDIDENPALSASVRQVEIPCFHSFLLVTTTMSN